MILVTGGSGFIASHAILQLLAAGHRVRTTVRRADREPVLRALLHAGGAADEAALTVHVADLTADEGWAAAVAGCDAVLHMASPLPAGVPTREEELIQPARDGTLRVLRAARDAGVRRVVLTSSFAAIGYGHAPRTAPFDERDWTQIRPDTSAYVKSKTLAERAAWEFIAREGGAMELVAVNPVAVFGPVLGADYSSSLEILARLLDGSLPASPRLWFGVVDVRDVAALHITAMTHPAARGERFLATAGDFLSMADIARVLRSRLGDRARRVPTREIPTALLRLAAVFSARARSVLPEAGKQKNGTSAKARTLLGWSPRSNEEAILAGAESLLLRGLVARD